MKNNTLRYMLIGFGFSLLLLIVSTIASFISINRLIESSETVNKSNKISLKLESIISNLKDAETGFRGFMLTKDSSFLQPYNGAYKRTIQNFDQVKTLTIDNPVQQKNLVELFPLIEKRFSIFDEGFKLYAAQETDKKILYNGLVAMDELRALIDKMQTEEARILANQNQELKQYTSTTPILVVGAAILSVLITMIAFMRIRSDLKKREIMQSQMEEAAEYMKQRVAIITDVAEKISTGNYSIRIDDKDKGSLGELSESLNKMATDLEENFSKLEKQAWLQQGIVQVNDQLKGEKNPAELTQSVLTDKENKLRKRVFYRINIKYIL